MAAVASSLDHSRIVSYALEHGTAAAARRFKLSDSYVRRLRREAGYAGVTGRPSVKQDSPARRELRVVAAPSVAVSRVTHLQLLPAQMVARTGTLWRCPSCRELVRVTPGTLWNNWIEQKKCLHGVLGDTTRSGEQLPKTIDTAASDKRLLESGNCALESDITVSEKRNEDCAGVTQLSSTSPAISAALASGPQLAGVTSFLLLWLAEYWRFVLGVVLGLALLLYLS
jgi:hypothetical protein